MQEELNKLKQDFENLKKEFDSLKASTTIPLNIDNAFRDRFKISEFVQLSATVKTAGSETQAVNEGGVATYSVAKPMDGFEERVVGGVARYYPYYL